MKNEITLDELIDENACDNDIKWFRENFPDGCSFEELENKLRAKSIDWLCWVVENIDLDSQDYNPNIPKEILVKLSDHADWLVRFAVASNLNTPREILLKLFDDDSIFVRCAVAEHPNTPTEILEKLANK